MTNRMLLDDPQIAIGTDTYTQRQLAEGTWPGAEFRVLLADQIFADGVALAPVNNLTLSLAANVRYYIRLFLIYNRTGTEDLTIDCNWVSGGNAWGASDNMSLNYYSSAGVESQASEWDLFAGGTFGTNSTAYVAKAEGMFSCTTAGVLELRATAPTADGNDATLYAGSHWIWQPIYNLSYESNP